jgi:hypothetical protein
MARPIGKRKPSEQASPGRHRRNSSRLHPGSEVILTLSDFGDTSIAAELLDISEGGFRIRYYGNYLRPGTPLIIRYDWGEVTARVVWAQVAKDGFEAGLIFQLRPCPSGNLPAK